MLIDPPVPGDDEVLVRVEAAAASRTEALVLASRERGVLVYSADMELTAGIDLPPEPGLPRSADPFPQTLVLPLEKITVARESAFGSPAP